MTKKCALSACLLASLLAGLVSSDESPSLEASYNCLMCTAANGFLSPEAQAACIWNSGNCIAASLSDCAQFHEDVQDFCLDRLEEITDPEGVQCRECIVYGHIDNDYDNDNKNGHDFTTVNSAPSMQTHCLRLSVEFTEVNSCTIYDCVDFAEGSARAYCVSLTNTIFEADPNFPGHECSVCNDFTGDADNEFNVAGMCLLHAINCGPELCLVLDPGEDGYEPENYQRRCLARAFHTGVTSPDDKMTSCLLYNPGSVQQRLCIQVASEESAEPAICAQFPVPEPSDFIEDFHLEHFDIDDSAIRFNSTRPSISLQLLCMQRVEKRHGCEEGLLFSDPFMQYQFLSMRTHVLQTSPLIREQLKPKRDGGRIAMSCQASICGEYGSADTRLLCMINAIKSEPGIARPVCDPSSEGYTGGPRPIMQVTDSTEQISYEYCYKEPSCEDCYMFNDDEWKRNHPTLAALCFRSAKFGTCTIESCSPFNMYSQPHCLRRARLDESTGDLMQCKNYVPDAPEEADWEGVYDNSYVLKGWAGHGKGSGQGSGVGSGTGLGYETPYNFQIRTAKLCINTATFNFGPSQCHSMSIQFDKTYGSYGSDNHASAIGSDEWENYQVSDHVHDMLWETCLTKSYDVWRKSGGTSLESDFTNCAACQDFNTPDGRDTSVFCLSKVRLTGGDCSIFDCLGFDTEEAQAACLSVADIGDTIPNECAACGMFSTPQLQRYCLFVSDHDCTEFDCDQMVDAPGKYISASARLAARRLDGTLTGESDRVWTRNVGKSCQGYAGGDGATRTLEESKTACISNSACLGIMCPTGQTTSCTLRAKVNYLDYSPEDCYTWEPDYFGNGMGKASYANEDAHWRVKSQPHVPETSGISMYVQASRLAEAAGDGPPARVEGDTKDSPYIMCRQRVWDTDVLVPQKVVTPHSCSLAVDLSTATSPIVGSTDKHPQGFNLCGHSNGAEDVYFIDVEPQWSLEIAITESTYDSMHSLRWGGDCPGENSGDALSWCVDDPDPKVSSFSNGSSETVRVYFTVNSYKPLERIGHHLIEWTVTSPESK